MSSVKTSEFRITSSASGGIVLTSGGIGLTTQGVRIVAITGPVHIGSNAFPPYVSGGYYLAPGENIEIRTTRPDLIRLFSPTSGRVISWIGV